MYVPVLYYFNLSFICEHILFLSYDISFGVDPLPYCNICRLVRVIMCVSILSHSPSDRACVSMLCSPSVLSPLQLRVALLCLSGWSYLRLTVAVYRGIIFVYLV
jgi:hypothetical protein